MIAHRHRMDMAKRRKRKRAQGPLCHACKDHISQLLKADIHQPRHAVSHGKPHRPRAKHPGRRLAFTGQGIHRRLIEKRRTDRDEFGHEKRDDRQHDAPLHPRLIGGPQVWGHAPNGAPAVFGHFRSCHLGMAHGLAFSITCPTHRPPIAQLPAPPYCGRVNTCPG